MSSDDILYILHAYTYFSELFWIDLNRILSIFAVEHSSRNVEVTDGQELVTFSSGLTQGSLRGSSDLASSSDSHSINDGTRRISASDSSEISGTIVQSNHNGQTGISIFQGYGFSAYRIFLCCRLVLLIFKF